MTTVENNTFTGPNAGVDGGYVPLTTIESTSVDGDLNLIKDDLNYHLSILQAIYTKLDTIETSATRDQTVTETVTLINASAELLDADNLESTVALLSNIISNIEAHRITTTQSAMHLEDSIKSTGQTYSYTPSSIVTSCQNILDEINNVRAQIHKILGQSTWIDTPNIDIASIKNKLDTIESGATTDQIASEVSNTPTGNIIAIDVQAAINELDTEKETPTAAQDKIDTHAALITSHGVSGSILGSEDKDVANGIAGLDAGGKLLESVYAGIGQKYEISDNLLNDHPETAWTVSYSYVKLLTTTINTLYPTPSTLRIKFDMKTGLSHDIVYGRIYKNGIAVGTERTTTSSSMVTFTEDISFAEGDTIEFWGHRDAEGSATLNMEKFRVYGDDDLTLAGAIISSDVGVADAWNATDTEP